MSAINRVIFPRFARNLQMPVLFNSKTLLQILYRQVRCTHTQRCNICQMEPVLPPLLPSPLLQLMRCTLLFLLLNYRCD